MTALSMLSDMLKDFLDWKGVTFVENDRLCLETGFDQSDNG